MCFNLIKINQSNQHLAVAQCQIMMWNSSMLRFLTVSYHFAQGPGTDRYRCGQWGDWPGQTSYEHVRKKSEKTQIRHRLFCLFLSENIVGCHLRYTLVDWGPRHKNLLLKEILNSPASSVCQKTWEVSQVPNQSVKRIDRKVRQLKKHGMQAGRFHFCLEHVRFSYHNCVAVQLALPTELWGSEPLTQPPQVELLAQAAGNDFQTQKILTEDK